MSGDPTIAILLMGLGIDALSTSPLLLPKVKKAIRLAPFKLAKEVAKKAVRFNTGTEVQKFLKEKLRRVLKDLVEA
jgi:phosphotransferase system enzyme I (PtsI)